MRNLLKSNFVIAERALKSFAQDWIKRLFHLWLKVDIGHKPSGHQLESLKIVFDEESLVEEIGSICKIFGDLFEKRSCLKNFDWERNIHY